MKICELVLAIASIVNIGLGAFWYKLGNVDGVVLASWSFVLCVIAIYIRGIK
jgi:hypothetical protein